MEDVLVVHVGHLPVLRRDLAQQHSRDRREVAARERVLREDDVLPRDQRVEDGHGLARLVLCFFRVGGVRVLATAPGCLAEAARQRLGRGCVFRRRHAWERRAGARGWMNQREEPMLDYLIACRAPMSPQEKLLCFFLVCYWPLDGSVNPALIAAS